MSFNKNMLTGGRRAPGHYLFNAALVTALVMSFGGTNSFVSFIIPAVSAEAGSVDGGQLYNTYCAVCHKSGLNAAPKFGSKPLWAKRIAQGRDTVYANAINGLRGMPARGGYAQLTDDEIKAATDYMVKAAGGWGD